MTGRRKFLLGFAALTVIGSARAQRQGKIYRIGLLVPALEPTPVDQMRLQVLRSALSELGWVDGTNLIIESRYVGVTPRRMRDVAAELKDIPVALIIAPGTIMIRAARDGAPGVPIIMVNAGDPVGSGFAVSLARPGGDLTGTSAAGEEVLAKQLELLSIAVPRLRRVSVLMNSANPANEFFFAAMSSRARKLDLQLDRIVVTASRRTGRCRHARQRWCAGRPGRSALRPAPHAHRGADVARPSPVGLRRPPLCRRRRPDVLPLIRRLALAQRSRFRRPDPEGCQARETFRSSSRPSSSW